MKNNFLFINSFRMERLPYQYSNTTRALLCVLIFSLTAGCGKKHADDDETDQPTGKALVAVAIAPITEGNVDVMVVATGKTEALRKEKIYSPVAGKIVSLKVLEGMMVKPDDLIASIQTKESYTAITGAEAQLKSAKTAEEKLEAKRTLDLALATQNTVNVHTKFSGVVSSRSVSEGELVAENSELLSLLDLSTIVFTANVLLPDLPSIHLGQSCAITFQSLPGREFGARVDAINPQSESESQTVNVRLSFTNLSSTEKNLLKTEMAGTAHIVTGSHRNVLTVPKSALLRNDELNSYSIVVMTADSLARTIPIVVGASTDSLVEISGDEVRKGMNIITEGNYALSDSTRVTVQK